MAEAKAAVPGVRLGEEALAPDVSKAIVVEAVVQDVPMAWVNWGPDSTIT
jgi:hypothetical protein